MVTNGRISKVSNGSATDQAIAEIIELISSGDFGAGEKLPNERALGQRLGLSRSSLREAVRALTIIGVLEPKVGDGTYVTTLEPGLLLTGIGVVSDLLAGSSLLELHRIRRILEPEATRLATSRLTPEDYAGLKRCLDDMDGAESVQAFIDADTEFHRIIVTASGNATLASLIQNLSSGTLRARLWQSVVERGAVEATKATHRGIYNALLARDEAMASAADLMHLGTSEEWLRGLVASTTRREKFERSAAPPTP